MVLQRRSSAVTGWFLLGCGVQLAVSSPTDRWGLLWVFYDIIAYITLVAMTLLCRCYNALLKSRHMQLPVCVSVFVYASFIC